MLLAQLYQPPHYSISLPLGIFLIVFGIIILILSLFFMWRIGQVAKYRLYIVDLIYKKNIDDLRNRRQINKNSYDILDKVSFNKMLFMFWKSVDSFFNLDKILK